MMMNESENLEKCFVWVLPGYGMRPYVTNSVSKIPKLHTSDLIENLL